MQKILEEIREKFITYIQKHKIQFTYYKKNNTYKHSITLVNTFPIETITSPVDIYKKCIIHGYTLIDVPKWISISPGIKIADIGKMKIQEMKICTKTYDNQDIPIEAIIHTFIHELAHTITIPEMIVSKNITQKRKHIQPTVKVQKPKHFMQNHHSDSFYSNFAKLLRIAEILDIYQLPKSHRNYTCKNLQRFDSCINPNDKLSLGYSKCYSGKN